jgi:hypothetical protein
MRGGNAGGKAFPQVATVSLMAGETTYATSCAECGAELPESPEIPPAERTPCETCGSLARRFSVGLSATLEVHSQLSVKAKSAGERRPFVEQKVGDDLHRRTGRWSRLVRLIDRRNDRYLEHIEDAGTGDVLSHVDTSLRSHRGHGDAKRPG